MGFDAHSEPDRRRVIKAKCFERPPAVVAAWRSADGVAGFYSIPPMRDTLVSGLEILEGLGLL